MGHTFVGTPGARHAVALKRDSRELGHRLDDVEVAERADFEEGHVVLLGERFRRGLAHLAVERQVQAVADQDLRNARCMLQTRMGSGKLYIVKLRVA